MLNVHDAILKNPQLFKQFKVNELLFVEYNCIIEETKKGFWSHKNIFFYVVEGKKKWVSLDKEYIIDTGDLLFVKKGAYIAHQIFNEDFCALIIFLPDEFIRKAILNHQINCAGKSGSAFNEPIVPLVSNDVIISYFHSLLQYFAQPDPPPKSLLELKFEELIVNILSIPQANQLTAYFRELCNSTKTSLREIMESNFAYDLSLEEFARLCGRSLSTFKRDFQKTFGVPPGKWLTARRLEYGKYLLENTDKDINEITFSCGYQDTSHFSKIFREKYGLPPLQYKNAGYSLLTF